MGILFVLLLILLLASLLYMYMLEVKKEQKLCINEPVHEIRVTWGREGLAKLALPNSPRQGLCC